MVKLLIYFSFLLVGLSSCEEYYTPAIDAVEGQLVVEAMITNDPVQNFVRLSRTNSFYDKQFTSVVSNATVSLVEINGVVSQGIESDVGYFTFNTTTPVAGRNYKLQIVFNNNTYESEVVTMPPIPSGTNFYTEHLEKKEYRTDGYGVPVPYTVVGRELYLDAPLTAELSNYRYSTRAVLEWTFTPKSMGGPPPPTVYGWLSFHSSDQYNIAGAKQFSMANKIEKQPLMMLPYDTRPIIPGNDPVGWIFILDQYGTSKGSFDFHEKLNSQFAATGTLFDPIQTQIYGNITCISDPSKTVFGYFDLNSYKQERFYIYLPGPNPNNSVAIRQIFNHPYIPDNGENVGFSPDWWEL